MEILTSLISLRLRNLLTFGYLSLPFLNLSSPFLTFPYLSIPFLTFPYLHFLGIFIAFIC